MQVSPLRAAAAVLALSPTVAAQSILVCHYSQNGGPGVASFSAQDGALQSSGFIDLTADGATVLEPYQAVPLGSRYWVTDRVLELAHVWNSSGVDYLGQQISGFGDLYGGVTAFGSTWFVQHTPGGGVTGSLVRVTGGTATAIPLSYNPTGIVRLGSELVVTAGNSVERFDPVSATELGTLYSTLSQGGHSQPTVASNGNLLIARVAGHSDIIELDAAGTIVAEYNVGSDLGLFAPHSCVELGNGDYLVSGEAGVWVVNSTFTAATELLHGVRARYATVLGIDLALGATYCGPAVPNSTGRSARIGATGSILASDHALRLSAFDLPEVQSGYFLAGQTQGFVMNPGGSSGNICLSGAIGRLSSQVQSSSSVRFIEIEVDTLAVPLPVGTTAILAGETWNWQCWYRDVVGGLNTSNFTDAVSVPFQ